MANSIFWVGRIFHDKLDSFEYFSSLVDIDTRDESGPQKYTVTQGPTQPIGFWVDGFLYSALDRIGLGWVLVKDSQ